jgi:Uma2 family endonuclease
MQEITSIAQLDTNLRYTYADYLRWKFEETVELIKGRIIQMSAPSRKHQAVSRDLSGLFFNYFKQHNCHFYAAPFDVRLLDRQKSAKANHEIYTVVQPDLCIICDESKLDDRGCVGAPDLVVEILSPGNSAKEMRVKKDLYEENGIREYWIIDPEHETAHQFVLLDSGAYSPATIYINEDTLQCGIFPELRVYLREVFERG